LGQKLGENAISQTAVGLSERAGGAVQGIVMTVGGLFCFEIASKDKDLTNDEICGIVGVTLGA
jgi:hypothetical protein